MEVILRQRVEKLGQMGDVVRVKPGYARNYLIPQSMAYRATKDKIAEFEGQRAQLEAHNLELKKEAEAVSVKMKDITLVLIRQAGESGHLYGSVRPQDIAESLKEAGFTVSRTQVKIATPVKDLGIHKVQVALHPEVMIEVTLNVALSKEEAEAQMQAFLNPKKEDESAEKEASQIKKEKAEAAAEEAVAAEKAETVDAGSDENPE